MKVSRATILVVTTATCLRSAGAFAPPRAVRISEPTLTTASCPPLSAAGPPVISNWRLSPSGSVSGTVTNHPTIPDGEKITTSPVKDPDGLDEGLVVQTKSGSRYKLKNVAFGARVPAAEKRRAKEAAAKEAAAGKKAAAAAAAAQQKRVAEEKKAAAAAAAAEKKRIAEEKKSAAATARSKSSPQKSPAPTKTSPSPAKSPATEATKIAPAALRKLAKSTFSLTGTTVGLGGSYLLAGKPTQSSGRAAKIWTAYLADADVPDVPAGFGEGDAAGVEALTVKLSPDFERLRLENANYEKVQSGIFSGRFVRKVDYVPGIPSSDRRLDGRVSALIIEAGRYDLKALLAARKGAPLRGRALRDAAASAGQCVQAVHSSGLVWTDLKTENFVVVGSGATFEREVTDNSGNLGLPGVKGIDLESVVARGGNPIDYSPEACPPEFARAYMAGTGEDFVLDYSYDMWSLGMMLYEVSTGVPYFEKKTPAMVTKALCDEAFEADVGAVPDANMRDLIGKCLSIEPGKRPDITGFLLHPYFLTTGFGPISF